jgi:predicted PurR-regulated permease PerM
MADWIDFMSPRATAPTDRGALWRCSTGISAPRRRHAGETATVLRAWLRGQFVAMLAVGLITWLGFLLLDVALGLAFLAFLLEFIPVLGPIAAAVPAILVGLSVSPMLGLWVMLLYIAIQQVESDLLLPLATLGGSSRRR